VREAIEAQGAPPPYILDLNSIEPGFAKFKAALRKAAGRLSSRPYGRPLAAPSTATPRPPLISPHG
jgi:hypothetical protein